MATKFLLYNKHSIFPANFRVSLLLRNTHKPYLTQLFADCFIEQESETVKICPSCGISCLGHYSKKSLVNFPSKTDLPLSD